MIRRWIAAVFLTAALAAPGVGHHSVRATYDSTRLVTITGTLTRIDWRNPHSRLELRVIGGNGSSSTERIEMAGPGSLAREGIDPDLFQVGVVIRVEAWPPREDAPDKEVLGLAGITVTLPDGRRLDVRDRWGEVRTGQN